MKRRQHIYLLALLVALCTGILVSCEEDKPDALALERMFRPGVIEVTNGETSVEIVWSQPQFPEQGSGYTLEVSATEDFATIAHTVQTAETEVVITDDVLLIKQNYFARIKANGKTAAEDSKWAASDVFQITGEQFLTPVADADIIDQAVIIRWEQNDGLTKIILSSGGVTVREIVLTDEDRAAGELLIEDLTGGTTYSVEIFATDKSKGSRDFLTKTGITGDNVIDLRSITGRPSVLTDTLAQIASGSIIVLKRGEQYTVAAAFDLSKSVTIVSGLDFGTELARIYFTNNFNLVANAAIDSLVFKDLYMSSDNYDSRYVFNINRAGTIKKVKFENVRGHKFRGFFRMQTGGAGTKVTELLSIHNCEIDSLRDFSLVNTNNSNTVANIRITNSTVYNARKVIDHRSPGLNSILIQNCTFNNLPTGGAAGTGTFYFIDLGTTQNSANPIIIENCIFGKTRDEGLGGSDAHGIRTGNATTISVTNSYKTSDFITSVEAFQIPSLSSYSGTSYGLFTDPDKGKFTIKDSGFAGKNSAGDPRWR